MFITYCPVCRLPGGDAFRLCPSCMRLAQKDMFDSFMIRCPVCLKPLVSTQYYCTVCAMRIYSLFDYGAPFMRRVMEDWKFNSNRKLSPLMGNFYHQALSDLGLEKTDCTLVKVPSTRKNDQMNDIIRFLKRKKGYEVADIIISDKEHAVQQKTLNRKERIEQASKKFFLRQNCTFPSNRIVILDDITTTGASLEACRKLLEENSMQVWGAVTLLREL